MARSEKDKKKRQALDDMQLTPDEWLRVKRCLRLLTVRHDAHLQSVVWLTRVLESVRRSGTAVVLVRKWTKPSPCPSSSRSVAPPVAERPKQGRVCRIQARARGWMPEDQGILREDG